MAFENEIPEPRSESDDTEAPCRPRDQSRQREHAQALEKSRLCAGAKRFQRLERRLLLPAIAAAPNDDVKLDTADVSHANESQLLSNGVQNVPCVRAPFETADRLA